MNTEQLFINIDENLTDYWTRFMYHVLYIKNI